jgi:hypothetical protein
LEGALPSALQQQSAWQALTIPAQSGLAQPLMYWPDGAHRAKLHLPHDGHHSKPGTPIKYNQLNQWVK